MIPLFPDMKAGIDAPASKTTAPQDMAKGKGNVVMPVFGDVLKQGQTPTRQSLPVPFADGPDNNPDDETNLSGKIDAQLTEGKSMPRASSLALSSAWQPAAAGAEVPSEAVLSKDSMPSVGTGFSSKIVIPETTLRQGGLPDGIAGEQLSGEPPTGVIMAVIPSEREGRRDASEARSIPLEQSGGDFAGDREQDRRPVSVRIDVSTPEVSSAIAEDTASGNDLTRPSGIQDPATIQRNEPLDNSARLASTGNDIVPADRATRGEESGDVPSLSLPPGAANASLSSGIQPIARLVSQDQRAEDAQPITRSVAQGEGTQDVQPVIRSVSQDLGSEDTRSTTRLVTPAQEAASNRSAPLLQILQGDISADAVVDRDVAVANGEADSVRVTAPPQALPPAEVNGGDEAGMRVAARGEAEETRSAPPLPVQPRAMDADTAVAMGGSRIAQNDDGQGNARVAVAPPASSSAIRADGGSVIPPMTRGEGVEVGNPSSSVPPMPIQPSSGTINVDFPATEADSAANNTGNTQNVARADTAVDIRSASPAPASPQPSNNTADLAGTTDNPAAVRPVIQAEGIEGARPVSIPAVSVTESDDIAPRPTLSAEKADGKGSVAIQAASTAPPPQGEETAPIVASQGVDPRTQGSPTDESRPVTTTAAPPMASPIDRSVTARGGNDRFTPYSVNGERVAETRSVSAPATQVAPAIPIAVATTQNLAGKVGKPEEGGPSLRQSRADRSALTHQADPRISVESSTDDQTTSTAGQGTGSAFVAASAPASPTSAPSTPTTGSMPVAVPVLPGGASPITIMPEATGREAMIDIPVDADAGLVTRTTEPAAEVRAQILPQRPVTASGADVLQEIVRATLVTKGPSTIELRLDPSDLGTLDIELTFNDDRVSILVRGDRDDGLDLMRRSSDELTRMMRQAGVDLDTLNFSRGGHSQGQAKGESFASITGEDSMTTDETGLQAEALPTRMPDRIDIRI